MDTHIFSDIVLNAGVIVLITGAVFGIFKFIFYNDRMKSSRRKSRRAAFDQTVAQLSSDVKSSQLSAAILLRRFLGEETAKLYPYLQHEAVGVISSLSKTLPTSVFQKSLVDGLAYATDLSCCDLQKANLQDVLLNNKERRLKMDKSDLFLADLSYANLDNIQGHGIVFYNAILFCTRIKNCDFSNADFRGADLTNVSFNNVILTGANFSDAINVPDLIAEKLVNGVYKEVSPVVAKRSYNSKNIFFSMPGLMSKEDELLTKEYKRLLESRGFEVIYYNNDEYPRFGQFNRVRADVMRSCAMVAFGLKQIKVEKGEYRPNTADSKEWNGKWLSTPWSEIEVGMALMKGMPILMVSDPEISTGVFDKELSECFVSRLSTREDCRKLEQNSVFEEWISKI